MSPLNPLMQTFSLLPESLYRAFLKGDALKMEGYRGRFAPSPSGPLHLGNLRTALISWLIARKNNGQWILRIDDLDTQRNQSGSIESIQKDLSWLGLTWDAPIVFQSNRLALYNSALSFLKDKGTLFSCFCTRKFLASRPNLDENISSCQCRCRELKLPWTVLNDKLPSWRLKVDNDFSAINRDVIVRRSDGLIAYNLATVIDEITLGITEVIRGYDLIEAIPAQQAIFESFSKKPIPFKHVPIVIEKDGAKLSKRKGSNCLEFYKHKGLNSSQIIGWLAESLDLVPSKSELTAAELLFEISKNSTKINLNKPSSFLGSIN